MTTKHDKINPSLHINHHLQIVSKNPTIEFILPSNFDDRWQPLNVAPTFVNINGQCSENTWTIKSHNQLFWCQSNKSYNCFSV